MVSLGGIIMLNIIICEDNASQRIQIQTIIETEITNLELDFRVDVSTDNSEDVIDYVKNNKQKSFIYFLDVDLNTERNGIELAKNIRDYDSNGYIVFITSHSELSLLTFQYKVQALDYILKENTDILSTKINECLLTAYNDYKHLNTKENSIIAIDLGNRIMNFALADILFFETTEIDHKLRIHTVDGYFEFYGAMKEIEKQISSDYYKTHRSYLVNTKKIKYIDKKNHTIIMVNNETCYVSERLMKGLIRNV